MISIVTWLWQQEGYNKFGPQHVNVLWSMVARNMGLPFQFVCFTDSPRGISSEVRVEPLPETPKVTWPRGRPNCFRRLWVFSEQARAVLGDRFMSLDLDIVIVRGIEPLVLRREDFVVWSDPFDPRRYNGSLYVMQTGTRRHVWDDFRGQESLREVKAREGSDQGWFRVKLRNEATFEVNDGVYSYKKHLRNRPLPSNARVVVFHGNPTPWKVAAIPWVRQNYR